jgi:hypothetical protein
MPALRGVRDRAEDQHRQNPEIQAAGDGEGGVMTMPAPVIGQLRLPVPSGIPQPIAISK